MILTLIAFFGICSALPKAYLKDEKNPAYGGRLDLLMKEPEINEWLDKWGKDRPAIIGYIPRVGFEESLKLFERTARVNEEYNWVLAASGKMLGRSSLKTPSFWVYLPERDYYEAQDGRRRTRFKWKMEDEKDYKGVQEWIWIAGWSGVTEADEDNMAGHYKASKFYGKWPMLVAFLDFDRSEKAGKKAYKKIANRLRMVAEDYRGQQLDAPEVRFMIAKRSNSKFADFGFTEENCPDICVGLKNAEGNEFFAMEEEFDSDNVKDFIEDWKAGKLTPVGGAGDAKGEL